MSDRDLILPGRALSEITNSLRRDMRKLKSRIQLTGAGNEDIEKDFQAITVGDSDTEGVWNPLTGGDWQAIASVDVDPGGWVILGNTVLASTPTGDAYSEAFYAGVRITGSGVLLSTVNLMQDGISGDLLWAFHLGAEADALFSAPTTISLEVSCATGGGLGGIGAQDTRLTAVPG